MIGALRLVPPHPDRPLATEHDFALRLDDRAAVDAGRLVARPQAQAQRTHYLLGRAWLTVRALGHDRVVSAPPAPMIEFYRGLGMSIRVLGPPRLHRGAERAPIEIAGSAEGFKRRRHAHLVPSGCPGSCARGSLSPSEEDRRCEGA